MTINEESAETAAKASKPVKTPKDVQTEEIQVADKQEKKYYANSSSNSKAIADIEAKVDLIFEANKEQGLRKLVSITKLYEADAFRGVSGKHWNPKMRPFIVVNNKSRGNTIDLVKTLFYLSSAYSFIKSVAQDGGRILFVGTGKQAIKEHIEEEAKRTKALYITQRWLGGTLTNFRTISRSIEKLNKNVSLQLSDEIKKYSKKEQLDISKETEKLNRFIGGIRTMKSLPQVMIVTDPIVEHNAITEARKLRIPVIALSNTNAKPELVDFIIPCNTNSIRTIWLLVSVLFDAIAEANNEPTKIVNKRDSEIVLPEVAQRVISSAPIISHKKFNKK